ncbi:RHS repeat protein [Flavobacterium restrictum]|uniref:RHS repeat protein n=2 Tax=Flavobacterium restrictum TaxID=2594428 RepID=A0A553E3A0_9FLAO|nr:RHS repeat protein [Flavobacterium restrictum]
MQIAVGQVNTDLRPAVKSPEVNKFEQYLNMPVNLVSGTPQVSIPIYTLEYGGMSLPISLEYDASGVKVESIASSVGQNWSLNVGGVVSRIVKGAPDEGYVGNASSQLNVSGYYKDYGLTKLDSELAVFPAGLGSRYSQFNWWLEDVNLGLKDSQPDLFYFSTPEGGSKFVFNELREIVYTENTDFIIKEDFIPNYFRTWLVTSPNGNKYKFGLSTGTNFGLNNAVEKNYTNQSIDEIVFDNNFTINSWFLTEISNYTNPNVIQLEYVTNNYSHTIINKPTSKGPLCTPKLIPNVCPLSESAYSQFAENPVNSTSQNHIVSKLISKIKAGKTEINFIYGNRDDLTPELGVTPQRLNEIQITVIDPVAAIAVCVKKIKFNYTTVQSSITNQSVNITDLKRLQLNSMAEMSCDEKVVKTHTFVYNTTSLPSKLSFAQDKWGYYNGKTNPSLYPANGITISSNLYADRNVDFVYAKAGALEKIIYPTKGAVEFKYEQHKTEEPLDYYYDINNPLLPFLTTATSTQSTTGTYSSVFTYNSAAAETLLLQASFSYNPTGGAGCGPSNDVAAQVMDNVTNTIVAQINYQSLTFSKTVLLPIDKKLLVNQRQYTLIVKGYGGANGMNYMCNICSGTVKRIPIIPIYDVGGLRIKNIIHSDFDNSIIKQTSYTYFQPKIVNNPKLFYKTEWNVSNSKFLTNFFSAVPANALAFNQILVSESNRTGFDIGSYYDFSTGTDPLDINFIGPNISYAEVDETDGNGITKHLFNRYKNYFELNSFSSDYGLPAEPKFQSILAGEKQSVTRYDANGNVVKQNNYDHNYSTTETSVKGLITKVRNDNQGLVLLFNIYKIQGQIKTLKTETETTRLGGQDVTTTMDYEYRPDNKHFQPIKTTLTDNAGTQKLITQMYYPDDMGTAPYMADLLIQNRKATPIRVETFRGTTAATDKLSEQQTVYAMDATTSNLVLPKSVYAAKFPNFNTPITTPNVGALEKKVTSDLYDASGNLLQFTPDSGVPVALIWGYNKTQPIAKIENATYSLVASLVANLQTISDTGTEASLLAALTTFRNTASLSSAMITTYTYIPLVGVSTITDPKGDKITYTYDALNRLKWVRDKDGNILSENQYHYKN